MNLMYRLILPACLFLTVSPAMADDPSNPFAPGDGLKVLTQDLVNLGAYLGYTITKPASTTPSSVLLNSSTTQLAQTYLYYTMLGALPVNAFSEALEQFVPQSSDYSFTNKLANTTFPNYSNATSQQGSISVNSMMDQKTYQPDPVNQAVLNILGTPDYTFCMTSTQATELKTDCPFMPEAQVIGNVIGPLPGPEAFFSYDYTQTFLSQLNSNTLIGPLLFSNPGTASSTSSSAPSSQSEGLIAPPDNQMQQADNFIRYASGSVVPVTLPKWADYDSLFTAANTPGTDAQGIIAQKQAETILGTYLAGLRVYAAQKSVGISNLYYIMSKRMPQKPVPSQPNPTSQAMSEFNMASWRLFKPDSAAAGNKNSQWITDINTASPATVQKEIVTLLAEINYQLYLTRQQEERILLTNSMLLLQSINGNRPIAPTIGSADNGSINSN